MPIRKLKPFVATCCVCHDKKHDCLTVRRRIEYKVSMFHQEPVSMCGACRKDQRGKWKGC